MGGLGTNRELEEGVVVPHSLIRVSSDWAKTEYNNQSSPSTYLSEGPWNTADPTTPDPVEMDRPAVIGLPG